MTKYKRGSYNPELILKVGDWCRGYEGVSLEHMPLYYFRGFKHLCDLVPERDKDGKVRKGPPKYQFDQVLWIIDAYGKFKVTIKCEGEGNTCGEIADKIAIPWHKRDRHEKESGPDIKKQFHIPGASFMCPDCYTDFSDQQISSSRYGGYDKNVHVFDINFKIFDPMKAFYEDDWVLNRQELHKIFRNVSYVLTSQSADEPMNRRQINSVGNFRLSDKDTKLIVNRLLRTGARQLLIPGPPEHEIKEHNVEFLSYRNWKPVQIDVE
jgi:hypothetical protein